MAFFLENLEKLKEASVISLTRDSVASAVRLYFSPVTLTRAALRRFVYRRLAANHLRSKRKKRLDEWQTAHEPGHPHIAQEEYYSVLKHPGELEEARDLLRQALESDQRSLARLQTNLARVLRDLGELEEARDLLRQALDSARRSLEPGHLRIAIHQSNLALVLKDLGELEEARDLLRQAHECFLERCGSDHHLTKTAAGNLAAVVSVIEG